jgi:hypothetical protein
MYKAYIAGVITAHNILVIMNLPVFVGGGGPSASLGTGGAGSCKLIRVEFLRSIWYFIGKEAQRLS